MQGTTGTNIGGSVNSQQGNTPGTSPEHLITTPVQEALQSKGRGLRDWPRYLRRFFMPVRSICGKMSDNRQTEPWINFYIASDSSRLEWPWILRTRTGF